jgi:DNA-binding MarR family transcriptional regulator
VALQKNLQRVEAALGRLGRIANSPKSDALRCERANVEPISAVGQRILRHVVERGPARISEIARATRTGDAAVSRQVTQLESQGLLRRESDARDGRAAVVYVSNEGRRISERLRAAADAIFQEHLSGWSSNELETLGELMEQLAEDLSSPGTHGRNQGR